MNILDRDTRRLRGIGALLVASVLVGCTAGSGAQGPATPDPDDSPVAGPVTPESGVVETTAPPATHDVHWPLSAAPLPVPGAYEDGDWRVWITRAEIVDADHGGNQAPAGHELLLVGLRAIHDGVVPDNADLEVAFVDSSGIATTPSSDFTPRAPFGTNGATGELIFVIGEGAHHDGYLAAWTTTSSDPVFFALFPHGIFIPTDPFARTYPDTLDIGNAEVVAGQFADGDSGWILNVFTTPIPHDANGVEAREGHTLIVATLQARHDGPLPATRPDPHIAVITENGDVTSANDTFAPQRRFGDEIYQDSQEQWRWKTEGHFVFEVPTGARHTMILAVFPTGSNNPVFVRAS